MENKIYGYIYKITNLVNGKCYIGQTVQSIKKRFDEHYYSSKTSKTIITIAMKKYGKENFKIEEISVAYNQDQLNFSEGFYINSFNTLAPNGYNIKDVIDGKGKHSKETIEKMKIQANTPERLKLSSELGKKTRGKAIKNSKSKYCGVSIVDSGYRSAISLNKKCIYLGLYQNEVDAAKVYDISAIKYFGHDCNLNFPELRQDYIDGKIIILKKRKIHYNKYKYIIFSKRDNAWIYTWVDKISNKRKCKHFKTKKNALKFKVQNELNN